MKQLKKGTPIFFKSLPKTENSRDGDAIYLEYKGEIPPGKVVHKILWRGDEWFCGDEDFLTMPEALAKTAGNYRAEIEAVQKDGMRSPDIAKALGISPGTLRKRMAMIRNHLPQETKAA